MVTPDEQRALQLENAKADSDRWATIRDLNASTAADHEHVAAKANEVITKGKAQAADADSEVKAAQGRIEAIQRGETVEGGLGKEEMTVETLLGLASPWPTCATSGCWPQFRKSAGRNFGKSSTVCATTRCGAQRRRLREQSCANMATAEPGALFRRFERQRSC